ncbi:MAG: DUF134 domain-containing protein [Saccharofermentans sp.]|nr:DUF134 domain-containing protein [Saccharofermentans sp.]
MTRRPRCRCIGQYPDHWSFSPDEASSDETVIMSLDEYETIRLIDKEDLTQEECAERMGVARTTVTSIYNSARKKIAEAIIDGKALKISGGAYQIKELDLGLTKKGSKTMRIAVTYEDGNIFQHFGHTEQFKIYNVEEGKIVSSQIVDTNGSGHGALAGFLKAAEVDALICGGIGMGAQMALAEAGIQLFGGVQGNADAAAKALAEGNLTYDPNAKCDHHDHHEGGCGEHDCHHGNCNG